MPPLDWMDVKAPGGGVGAGAGDDGGGGDDVSAILADLNEPQREAVTHGDGPMLILAGAGSGKTRVITRRIAWLVATGRATPREIVAITFTNKAAREMRSRVEAFLPVQGMWISTFHSMCARILRREIGHLGAWTRDFTIYDTHDRNLLLKTLIKDLGYDVQRFRPAMLGAWISDWKTGRYDRRDEEEATGAGIEEEVFRRVRERYETAMREANALDFDDLLVKVLLLFDEHPGVRDAYASGFRHVLVDEYQDTNRTQYLLTRHLARWHGNLAVCGDPDQSIYAWRGADIRNILDFEEDFDTDAGVRTVKLEQNYRSTDCILAAAQGLIRHNRHRKEKELWTEKTGGQKIAVVQCADENDEANEITARIHALRKAGRRPDQIAVFYRVNFMQRALERAMRLSGVPYQIVGGVEFYQRREIRDLISYLHLAVNPRDDVACRRVINVPARSIGDRSVERLAEWASGRGVPLLEAARSNEARASIRGPARRGIAAFAELMDRLADLAGQPASRALEAVIEETDYLDWLSRGGEDDPVNREENVEELLTHTATWDAENPDGGLRGFLEEVALVSDVDGWDDTGPKVTLMTLHSSKGLEFPVVFVAGLEEELLPHALALSDAEREEDGVEEERRLMYVGMTRAQDELYLTHAQTRLHYGASSWRVPSRFLDEIPAEHLEGMDADEAEEDLGVYEAPDDAPELRVGDRVEHDHFGYGFVERLQGSGINARATVDFQAVGQKVLLVQYANLRVIGR